MSDPFDRGQNINIQYPTRNFQLPSKTFNPVNPAHGPGQLAVSG